jgi:hypothetical protein
MADPGYHSGFSRPSMVDGAKVDVVIEWDPPELQYIAFPDESKELCELVQFTDSVVKVGTI